MPSYYTWPPKNIEHKKNSNSEESNKRKNNMNLKSITDIFYSGDIGAERHFSCIRPGMLCIAIINKSSKLNVIKFLFKLIIYSSNLHF